MVGDGEDIVVLCPPLANAARTAALVLDEGFSRNVFVLVVIIPLVDNLCNCTAMDVAGGVVGGGDGV